MKRVGGWGLMLVALLQFTHLLGQTTKHVLFLGNSYTASNNLPQMVADAALSAGDTLFFDLHTPGGYTFQMHASDATAGSKVAQGGWDYVVLQEQSQRPSFPLAQVMSDVFPYAAQLNQQIKQHNPCSETVFFMTWGRKNGDAMNCAVWPPVCTYAGMDSLLHLRYMMLADSNQSVVSPVGALWRFIRTAYPDIDLYTPDESHPSYEGSYAAACAFYSVIFRKDPSDIVWNGALDASVADQIRQSARAVVFDSLAHWRIGQYDPVADFQFNNTTGTTVAFTNLSTNASQYHWDFGDGNTSQLEHPVHQYQSNGQYPVTLISIHCDKRDTLTQTIQITGVGIDHVVAELANPRVYPNPARDQLFIQPNGRAVFSLSILTTTGKTIGVHHQTATEPFIIDISTLKKGIYIVQLVTDEGVYAQKVVKI
jgi:hypothetical protein